MENKQNWIQSLFRHKLAKQANTPPLTPQVQPEAVSPLPSNIPISAPLQSPPLVQSVVPSVPSARARSAVDNVPAIWKVGDFILNEFDVMSILGEGGMGTVYKIYYRPWSRDLAVKSPRPEIFVKGSGKENFIREAETWMDLKEHPHLVRCYFVRTLGDIPRVFAEYVDGGSLKDWICQRKLYEGSQERTLERMLDVAIQIAWGLHAAHEQGLVHQDVKPANVMLTSQGIAKVTDFGLAKARAMTGEQEMQDKYGHQSILVSSRGMTPAYCSPEQAVGQKLSSKTDIWSWGLSVLEMFTGDVTWEIGVAAREVLAGYERREPIIPMMPTEVMNVLNRCFQHQPEARPATMLEVATEMQAIYVHSAGHLYSREMPKSAEIGTIPFTIRGDSLAELGRFKEALVAYEQAIRLDPNDVLAYTGKAIVLRDLGRPEEALVTYEQAIHIAPNFARAYYSEGNMFRDLGRPEEALIAYEQAIRLDPNNIHAYVNQGTVLQDLGRPEEALIAYEQAIRLDPNNNYAYTNQGNVLQNLGRLEEALAAFEQAIRLDPNDVLAYTNQGNVLYMLGWREEALVAYKQAIRINPNHARAYYNQGVVLRNLGRREEALAAFEQAIRLDPNYASAYHNQGAVLQDLGRLEEALVAYEQATRIYPNYASAYMDQGGVLYMLGRFKEAEQVYQKGQELSH